MPSFAMRFNTWQIPRCIQLVVDPDMLYSSLKQNAYTRHFIGLLRHISILNNSMVQISPTLATLQASFKAKNSFSHIQRLHNMLYAYGATIIEIVRRKEFCEFSRLYGSLFSLTLYGSTIFLPASTKYTRSYGKTLVGISLEDIADLK